MKKTYCSFSCLFLSFLLTLNAESIVGGGTPTSSTLTYNLDACDAFVLAGTIRDYSEFIGESVNDPSCSQLSAISTIYRDNPDVNTHSCTPGVNDSKAMCVNSVEACTYQPESDKAIKFDIMVTPGPSGTGNISSLSFFEQAPTNYNWISGPIGLNNYPTKYGIRVFKNGAEIYQSSNIATTNDWTLQEFDFSTLPDFTVDAPSIFSFELLAYCVVGINSNVTAWDIDEVVVTSTCPGDDLNGGLLTLEDGTTNISICANDGISDVFDVILTDANGSGSTWIITDDAGEIIGLPLSPPFDLEGAGAGVCYLWHITSEGILTGVDLGNNVASIVGCYALSNAIVVDRNMTSGSTISLVNGATSLEVCAGDGISDAFDVILSGSSSINNNWVITDTLGNILDLPLSSPFDLEGAGAGVCLIWNISYDSPITGLATGLNVSGISGCYGLSNAITVTRYSATAGTISSNGLTELEICAGDGLADFIDVQVTGNVGASQQWIITDADGHITNLSSFPPFNLESAISGTCYIQHLSYEGPISGLAFGNRLSEISGCFGLSNPITVNKIRTTGGILSYNNMTFLQICSDDPFLTDFTPTLFGNVGNNLTWLLTDEFGVVIEFIAGPPFDLSSYTGNRYRIYALSYNDIDPGITVGQNVEILAANCAGLSNPIVLSKEILEGGTISSLTGDEINICVGGPTTPDMDIALSGNVGSSSGWIVTDTTGNIVALPGPPPFSINTFGLTNCLIYHISYEFSFVDLFLDNNISNFTGCYDLSNPISVNKQSALGGVISVDNNMSHIDICNNNNPIIDVSLINNVGDNQVWVLTDTSGMILDFPAGPPFDFSSYSDGEYRLWHLAFNGTISGADIGANANGISGDCFNLSNYVSINKVSVDAGMINTAQGDSISICAGDGIEDFIIVDIVGSNGINSGLVVTDISGNILSLPTSDTINIDSGLGSNCLIWNLAYNDISGLNVGNNAANLQGCFDLSNPITLNKVAASGGDLSVGTNMSNISFCNNDIAIVNVVLNNNSGDNEAWVITDAAGTILDLPSGPPFDFSAYANGEYRIWNLAYNGNINGATIGENATNLSGDCFSLSNYVSVNISSADGGLITSSLGDSLSICAGDGVEDIITIDVTGNSGTNSTLVITDLSGNIISFPTSNTFDVDNGITSGCVIWNLTFNDISGLTIGNNTSNLQGCFDLSNAITVNKTNVNGGIISSSLGSDITVCIDGINDNIDVALSGTSGSNNQWVITDVNGNILGLPMSPPFDFDSAGVGTCLIWNISYEDVTGLSEGNNVSALSGCYGFSNAITVNREMKNAGDLSVDGATELSICSGDGAPDPLDILVSGGDTTGNIAWLITDLDGNILGIPSALPIDLETAGPGTCLIWRVCYANGATGITLGGNANNITGCYDLSNAITVHRIYFEGNEMSTSSATFNLDNCESDSANGSNGDYSEFVATVDNSTECTTLTVMSHLYRHNPTTNRHSCTPGIDSTNAMCVSSYPFCTYVPDNDRAIRFSVIVEPPAEGQGVLSSLSFYEKAPIVYDWNNGPSGINNFPTRYALRVLKNGTEVFLQDEIATTNDWTLERFDFSTNPAFIISSTAQFEFELLAYCIVNNGAGVNAWDIDEISIESNCMSGLTSGYIMTSDGSTEVEVCADDGSPDLIDPMVVNASGEFSAWVITDEDLNILELPMAPPFDFEGADAGICQIWYLTYSDGLVGAEIGLNAGELQGCFALSNPITVTRLTGSDCVSNVIENEEEEKDEEEEVIQLEFVEGFKILPNPAVSLMIIETDKLPTAGTQLLIYDKMGEMIESRFVNEKLTEVILNTYPTGFYYAKIVSGENNSIRSFIKL